jgi:mono/diheme cytochrome c family protein
MPRRGLVAACASALVAVVVLAGCGERKIEVPKKDAAVHHGATLFNERCSGCHTLEAADARGSAPEGVVGKSERTDGPNFNIRKENRDDVLFAIRNGGFSGAIMPANIVVGRDAEDVALFVERYAGKKAPPTSGTKSSSPTGSSGNK